MATVNVHHEKHRETVTLSNWGGQVFREGKPGVVAETDVSFDYGGAADALDFLTEVFEKAKAELEAMLPASEEPEPVFLDRNGDPLVQEEIDRLVIVYDSDYFASDLDIDEELDPQYIGGSNWSWFVVEGYDVDDFKPAPEFKVGQVIKGDDYDKLPVGAKFSLGFGSWEKRADGFYLNNRLSSMVAGVDNGEANRLTERTITYLPS